jgi:GAF domain-containing protein
MTDEPIPARDDRTRHRDALRALGEAMRAATRASDPEAALRELTTRTPALLGDPHASRRPGALKPGEHQFSVSGLFMLTPGGQQNLLIADVGFPPEQHRLRIDVRLGHPGWVAKHQRPLILANTDEDPAFTQILTTARMGSALFAPVMWQGEFLGQLILASQARNTYAPIDLDILGVFAEAATALWIAHGGPAFLRTLA